MKKLSLKNLKFEVGNMLERKQLKSVFGGSGGYDGSCTATLTCNTGSISCTSPTGDCKRGWGDITCDGITYEC